MPNKSVVNNFLLGFIKIHILYHASQERVYGLWIIEELKHHGYTISPGTLYPILHSLERDGLVRSSRQVVNGKIRKYYSITRKGVLTLNEARKKTGELLKEITVDH